MYFIYDRETKFAINKNMLERLHLQFTKFDTHKTNKVIYSN